MTPDTSGFHARLAALEVLVRAAVDDRRTADGYPDDPFRGLYVTQERAMELLNRNADGSIHVSVELNPPAREDGRLANLATAFGLDAIDIQLLLVALAPDVDPRFRAALWLPAGRCHSPARHRRPRARTDRVRSE